MEHPSYTVTQPVSGMYIIEECGVRNFLFVGTDAALLIDTGFGTLDYGQIAAGITSLPLMVANSHCHADHVGGNSDFPQIYLHPAGFKMMYADPRNTQVTALPVREGYVFDLGGHHIEVVECPGHSLHDITFLDVENRLLAGGDAVMEQPIFLFQGLSNPALLKQSMQHLRALGDRYDLIYPSHDRCPLEKSALDEIEAAADLVLSGAPGEDYTIHLPDGPVISGRIFRSGACSLMLVTPPDSYQGT